MQTARPTSSSEVGKTIFGDMANQYAKYRLSYPDALFQFLADAAPARVRALDCATGNGQAAVGLAKYFDEVAATDASSEQLAQAQHLPNIRYSQSAAESTGFPVAHFDVLTVAMGVHWFDTDRFYTEASRVLKPEGVLAVWGYSAFDAEFPEPIAKALRENLYDALDPYWKPEVRMLMDGYRDLKFPYPLLDAPQFNVFDSYALEDWVGLISSWSALRLYEQEHGAGILQNLQQELAPLWTESLAIKLPLHLKATRI